MPVKGLPRSANLDHLRYQAKDLIRGHGSLDPQAAQRIREFHPHFRKATDRDIFDVRFSLGAAQLIVAREHGFATWARLKRHLEKPTPTETLTRPHHERVENPAFRRAVELLDSGDVEGLRAHLKTRPDLIHQRVVFEGGNYFRNPALLEFIAENPVRHGQLPPNIVEVARVILQAGAESDQAALNETLGLVSSGRVPRECQVQIPLIDLLCNFGADPNSGIPPALTHGEFEAVHSLIRRGARVDFPVATALGRVEDARALLANAGREDRHRALALAAQFGHSEIVKLLLDAGEDPNRYNPMGSHSHSTPLHQAALAGHYDVVRLLVERGARLDLKDTIWQGTAAGWAFTPRAAMSKDGRRVRVALESKSPGAPTKP